MREYGIEYSKINKEKAEDKIIDVKSDRKEPKVSEEENIKEMSILDDSNDSKDLKFKDNDIDNKMTQGTSEEKKESKWDKIDWSKTNSEEKKETKWDKIDWSKTNSEEKKETKWDKIDWSKTYSSEEKKIEEYKNDNIDDSVMTGGDYKEKIEDTNFNEKEINDKVDDLSSLKDFEEKISKDKIDFDKDYIEIVNENKYDNRDYEGINDISEEKGKNFEDLNDISEYDKWDFVENAKDKLNENDFVKDSLEGIDDELEHSDIVNDFMDVVEDELKYSEAKEVASEQQKDNNIYEFSENNYKNLLNERLQENFKEYHELTGKFANYGRNLRKDFIGWIERSEKNPDIITIAKEFQNNQDILNFIKDKIQNSDLSQNEIANQLIEKGLYCNHGTVRNIALSIYGDNNERYERRFSTQKYKPKTMEIKDSIIERLNNEVKSKKPDSLYKIQKDYPMVSLTSIAKMAKENIVPEIYNKIWAPVVEVSKEIKEKIGAVLEHEVNKEQTRSLKAIAKEFPEVSNIYVQKLAKKLYPDKYQELWPAVQKIPEEIKEEIIGTIRKESQKKDPRTLREIHKNFPEVGSDSIKRLARQAIPKEVHAKAWPPAFKEIKPEVKKKIEEVIKEQVNLENPRSLHDITKDFKVSREFVRNIAKRMIPKIQYEKIWAPSVKELAENLRNKIIGDIKSESKLSLTDIAMKNDVSRPTVANISRNYVFKDNQEEHKSRFPNDTNLELGTINHLNINALVTRNVMDISNQKYYSEPMIFPGKKKPDGLILDNENYLKKRLLNEKNGKYLRDILNIDLNKLEGIKATQLDYTNDTTKGNLLDKIEKYQSSDTMFFIIGTKWHLYDDIKNLPNDQRIKYPENVKVISHEFFADFIGLEGEDRATYNRILDLNYNNDLEALKTLYNCELSYINTYNTKDLKQELFQGGLIKDSFDEYFNFKDNDKKDDNSSQLDLDHFLNR